MSRFRRTRALTPEERKLWAHVAREIVPLKGRSQPEQPQPDTLPDTPMPASPRATPDPAPAPTPAARPRLPLLTPLDRKVKTALRRGVRAVDAVIDLHGMRQEEAHGTLLGFLRRSQAAGHTIILVITGKGAAASDGALFEERGVLRRVVPHWLRLPDVRPLVLGFEEAAPQHGGAGALYVRLRRRRPDAPSA